MLGTKSKLLIASAAAALVRPVLRLRGLGDCVVVKRDGLRWRLDLNEGIDFSIFLLRGFELGTTRAYRLLIKPGDVVLDIGANIGAHALQFARLVGERGRVFAFEPTAFAYSKLLQNLELNPKLRDRVVAEQIMLTDREDSPAQTEICSSWPLGKAPRLHPGHGGSPKSTVGCRVGTLDSYLSAAAVTRVDFIKLDVDGFEWNVLQGGIRSLSAFKPVILMELCPYLLVEHDHSLEELISLLAGIGFRFHRLSGRPLSMDPDHLRALIPPGSSLNIVGRVGEGYWGAMCSASSSAPCSRGWSLSLSPSCSGSGISRRNAASASRSGLTRRAWPNGGSSPTRAARWNSAPTIR